MKQPLLLLHGAIGSEKQFEKLKEELEGHYDVLTMNFSGHGGREIPGEFSIEQFAGEVMEFLNSKGIQRISIFGYSMGGYVALYLARHNPEVVERLVTLATKFNWTEETAAREVKMLQPDIIEGKLPQFAQELKERHSTADWKKVLTNTADMLLRMGVSNPLMVDDIKLISCPVLLMVGDKDKMVTAEETISVYRQLSSGQLAILPGTPHPIEQTDAAMIAYHLNRFLQKA